MPSSIESIAEIEKSLPKARRRADPLQAALIAIDPDTGAVRAMVGGRDFRASNFNRATRPSASPARRSSLLYMPPPSKAVSGPRISSKAWAIRSS